MTHILPNGVEVPDDDYYIWEAYDCCCVFHPDRFARALHEEPPKSKNPKWKDMPENRFPLCLDCHELVHRMSRSEAQDFLNTYREINYPKAVERIRKHERENES